MHHLTHKNDKFDLYQRIADHLEREGLGLARMEVSSKWGANGFSINTEGLDNKQKMRLHNFLQGTFYRLPRPAFMLKEKGLVSIYERSAPI